MRVIVRYFFLFTLTLTFTQAFAIDVEQGQTIYQTSCAKCHGVDGNTTTVNFPKLAGQHTTYLAKQVTDYQTGKRIDPIMAPIAQKLTPAQTENVLRC
jgi:cytochrome c553